MFFSAQPLVFVSYSGSCDPQGDSNKISEYAVRLSSRNWHQNTPLDAYTYFILTRATAGLRWFFSFVGNTLRR